MKVEFLVLPNGRSPIEDFLNDLDNKTLAKVFRLIDLLEQEGTLPFPHARKMQGHSNLWELRILSSRGAVRVFYVYYEKGRIVFVSGFMKKSQKTPQREIERALNYLKQTGAKI